MFDSPAVTAILTGVLGDTTAESLTAAGLEHGDHLARALCHAAIQADLLDKDLRRTLTDLLRETAADLSHLDTDPENHRHKLWNRDTTLGYAQTAALLTERLRYQLDLTRHLATSYRKATA